MTPAPSAADQAALTNAHLERTRLVLQLALEQGDPRRRDALVEAACCLMDIAAAAWLAELEGGEGPAPRLGAAAAPSRPVPPPDATVAGELLEIRNLLRQPQSFLRGLHGAAEEVLRGGGVSAETALRLASERRELGAARQRAVPGAETALRWLDELESMVERLRGQLEEQ